MVYYRFELEINRSLLYYFQLSKSKYTRTRIVDAIKNSGYIVISGETLSNMELDMHQNQNTVLSRYRSMDLIFVNN